MVTATKSWNAEVAQFAATLAREFPKASASQIGEIAVELLVKGKKLHRAAEQYCNGDISEQVYDHLCANVGKAIARVAKECLDEAPALSWRTGSDPRGCTLKLILPSGRTDDWGGEGFCVPGA